MELLIGDALRIILGLVGVDAPCRLVCRRFRDLATSISLVVTSPAILKYAIEDSYTLSTRTSHAAAKYGHLGTLKWARANGCPWDETTCEYAASSGHLEVLQWARANGCPCPSDIIILG